MNELALFAGAGELAPDVAPEELRQEKQVGGPVNCSDSELCTFLLALEAGFLPTYYSDTNQSVQLKSMSIASRSYRKGKKTVYFHGFQSLTMYKNSTENLGAELLTWYLAGFRVKTSAQQEKEQGSTESGPLCGDTWRGWLAKYDPNTSSWKTAQCSLLADSEESLETFPRWGMTRNGLLWERPTLAPIMSASGSGFQPDGVTTFHTPNTTGLDGVSNSRKAFKKRLMYPTPQASDNRNRGNSDTPAIARRIQSGKQVMLSMTVSGGQLNPDWVEWLMGWPTGWTDLKPLEMDKFRLWQKLHGSC